MNYGFGPMHPSAVTDRPASRSTPSNHPTTWFKDASSPAAMDGTVLDASWLNMVKARLEYLCQQAGLAATGDQAVDALLYEAVVAIARSNALTEVHHDGSLTGTGIPSAVLSAAPAIEAHVAASDPHPQYTTSGEVDIKIEALRTQLLGGDVSAALDTFFEVANRITTDESTLTALTSALAGKQPLDADLTAIAALAPAAGKLLVGAAGGWALLDASGIANDWAFVRDSTAASGFKFAAVSGGSPANVAWNTGGIIAQFTAAAATDIPLVVKGAAGQTANLQEWRTSTGTVIGSVSAAGVVSLQTSAVAGYSAFGLTQAGATIFGVTYYAGANVALILGGKAALQQAFADLTLGNDAGTTAVRLRTAGVDRAIITSNGIEIVSGLLKFVDGTTQSTAAITRAESSQLTMPGAAGWTTFAHGLGAAPKRWGAYAICVTASGDFAVGDTIDFSTDNGYSILTTVAANATSVKFGLSSGTLYAGPSFANIAGSANFKLVLWAEK